MGRQTITMFVVSQTMPSRAVTLARVGTHLGALLPLLLLIWDLQAGQLGADPIRATILRTGKAALVLLLLSLTCTPLRIIFGWRWPILLRRALGLYAFFYASLHLLAFVGLDYAFDPALIIEGLFQKRFALLGLASFVILIPLALTSTHAAFVRLGPVRWKRLHRWVYLAAILAVLHYAWLVKQAYTQPLLYAAILAVLLLIRLVPLIHRLRTAVARDS